MRILTLSRLIPVLILLLSATGTAQAASVSGVQPVFADRGGDTGGDHGDDTDDKDHGKNENDEIPDKEKHGKNGKDEEAVAAAAGYAIELTCQPEADALQTACHFNAVTPPDGKKVNHVLVPAGLACAEVAGGDARFVDPDPNVHLTGFRATSDAFTIVFAGTVTPGDLATYWVKAGGEVYPATGPGLACLGAESAARASTPAATTPPATGVVIVAVYACPAAEPGATDVDWFGTCAPDGEGLRFVLAPIEPGAGALYAAETVATGKATFSDLPPGSYDLDDPDRRWIYAESDHVSADGSVLVEAGATTTVWLFYGEA